MLATANVCRHTQYRVEKESDRIVWLSIYLQFRSTKQIDRYRSSEIRHHQKSNSNSNSNSGGGNGISNSSKHHSTGEEIPSWLKEKSYVLFWKKWKLWQKWCCKKIKHEELRVVQNYVHFVRVNNSTVQLCTSSTLTMC